MSEATLITTGPEDDIHWTANRIKIEIYPPDNETTTWSYNEFHIEPSDGSEEWHNYEDGFATRAELVAHAEDDAQGWLD